MSSGSASGPSSDSSDGTDDEDSESSSCSNPTQKLLVSPLTVDLTVEKIYQNWGFGAANKDAGDAAVEPEGACNDLATTVLDPKKELHIILSAQKTHISALPHELLLRVFRWTVGSHLDVRILGKLACVCKVFYVLAHDAAIWRSICIRLWPSLLDNRGQEVKGQPSADIPLRYGYKDWREMAIRKPHVLLDGCYLCRISYVRPGEALSGVYRPMHLVVYYRGIRFYSDGRVCMLTSYHPPNAVVAALGKHNSTAPMDSFTTRPGSDGDVAVIPHDHLSTSGGGLLQGTYVQLDPDIIVCTLFRSRNKEKPPPFRRRRQAQAFGSEQQVTYNIRFKLSSSKRRLHNVLHWDSYTIRQLNTSTQTDQLITLNVLSDQFPDCRFSHVRSYVASVAHEPL